MVHRITNDVSPLSVAEVRACASTAQEVAEALGVTPSPAQTARLAADLAAHPTVTEAESYGSTFIGEVDRYIRAQLPGPRDPGEWAFTVGVEHRVSDACDSWRFVVTGINAKWRTFSATSDRVEAVIEDARRQIVLIEHEAEIRQRVEREVAAIVAADRADKQTGEGAAVAPSVSSAPRENGIAAPQPTTTNTRDDGEATGGTLPLVKLGQGDYTREVMP